MALCGIQRHFDNELQYIFFEVIILEQNHMEKQYLQFSDVHTEHKIIMQV